jgi:hypothetical protein
MRWVTRELTSCSSGPEVRPWKKCYVFWIRCKNFYKPFRVLQFMISHSSDHLKSVPDLLETLMSEKRLLQAAVLLVRSLKTINSADMLEIGAVADLRSYLNGQEAVHTV